MTEVLSDWFRIEAEEAIDTARLGAIDLDDVLALMYSSGFRKNCQVSFDPTIESLSIEWADMNVTRLL